MLQKIVPMPLTDRTGLRITKASGEQADYDRSKLIQSLQRSGASDASIDQVVTELESELIDGVSTRKIYRKAFQLLRRTDIGAASQYNLKSAVMALGPSGYPFEQFVGELLKATGWTVDVGVMIQGRCVKHEVDVRASKDGVVRFMECKFRNEPGSKVDVKVALYVNSRVQDLIARHKADHVPDPAMGYQGWIVTNAKFSEDAETFGECAGMHLLAWDYPPGKGLLSWIRQTNLLPLTVLHSLSHKQKETLMGMGVVSCLDLRNQPDILSEAGIELSVRTRVLAELGSVLDRV